jgi:hypothetical protein
MNDELERMWKTAVVAYFKILFRHMPRVTEAKYETFHLG